MSESDGDVLIGALQESVSSLGAVLLSASEDITRLLVLMNANLHSMDQGLEALVKANGIGAISNQLTSLVAISRASVLNQLLLLDAAGLPVGYNAVKGADGVYCLVEDSSENPVDGVDDEDDVPKA